jgi:hypothetical protein
VQEVQLFKLEKNCTLKLKGFENRSAFQTVGRNSQFQRWLSPNTDKVSMPGKLLSFSSLPAGLQKTRDAEETEDIQ